MKTKAKVVVVGGGVVGVVGLTDNIHAYHKKYNKYHGMSQMSGSERCGPAPSPPIISKFGRFIQ